MKSVLLAFLALLLFTANASAQFVWQKTYGPFPDMYLSKMIPLSNGGYLLTGYQYAGAPSLFAPGYVVRKNANGDTLWTKKHLVPGSEFSICNDVVEDFDGNVIVVGEWGTNNTSPVNYNGFLYKLNTNGDTLWTRKIATPQRDSFNNIIIGNDSTYLVSAVIADTSYVQKYNATGSLLWSRTYAFSPSNLGQISYLHPSANGYFVFVQSGINASIFETKIYRIDENGNEQYSKKNKMRSIYDVATDANQNLLVCGNGRLFKLNPVGDTLWSKLYKRNNNYISLRSAKPTRDGNYIVLFEIYPIANKDVGFMKVDPNGVLIKDTLLYHNGTDYARDIVVDSNGDYVFAGYSGVPNGQVYFMAKYRKWNQLVGIKEEQQITSGIKLYPNPATENTAIDSEKPLTGMYSLYNLQG